MTHFRVGDIYQIHEGSLLKIDGFFRIVMATRRTRYVYLFPLPVPRHPDSSTRKTRSSHVRKPFPIERAKLALAVESSYAQKIEDATQPASLILPDKITGSSKKKFERSKKILEPLVAPDVMWAMLEQDEWSRRITAAAIEAAVDDLMIRRLLSKYFEVGMDLERACATRYLNCGRTPREKRRLLVLQGRKRKIVKTGHAPERTGVSSAPYREKVRIFLRTRHGKIEKLSKEFRDFKEQYSVISLSALADGTLVKTKEEDENFITPGQFSYLVKGIRGEPELKKSQIGKRTFLLKNRVLLGDARHRIGFPGHTFIIDATVADVYLVSAYDRSLLIGRPVIYVVIDAFSSLIVSLHVTLEGPNFEQAKIAIYRALTDKSSWLEWLGLQGLQSCFPQGCRPTFLFADRGELHSKDSREQAKIIRYAQSIAAPYRADWKSLVERYFKILNDAVIHWMPGAVRARAKERGERDVRLDAVLTLHEFTKIIAIECAEWNAYKDMSKHVSASMFVAGAEASPTGFWNWGVENLHATPYFLSKEEAVSKFLSIRPASISRRGIFESKNRYTANWMSDHPAVVGVSLGLDATAGIFRDPDNPLRAYCHIGGEQELKIVELGSFKPAHEPFTSEDILDFNELNELNGQERALDVEPAKTALSRLQSEIIQDAAASTQQSLQGTQKSKSERTRDVKKNRENEIEGIHDQDDMQNFAESTASQPELTTSDETAVMNMLVDEIDQWGNE